MLLPFIAAWSTLLVTPVASAAPPIQAENLEPLWKTRGLRLPLYEKWNAPPLGVIEVDHFHTSHQRSGFFRIGLFPVLVAENVKIDAYGTNDLASVINKAVLLIEVGGNHRLELRHVKLIWQENWIQAAHAQVSGEKISFEHATISYRGELEQFSQITLNIGREKSGEIRCKQGVRSWRVWCRGGERRGEQPQ